jgi:hypothetical protein
MSFFPTEAMTKPETGPAERARRRAFHGTIFGTCTGDDEIQMIQFQVFEIMIVTGEVGLHVVLLEDRQDVLDNLRLVAMGQSGRIGWVMAEDQFPFRLGSRERAVKPLKLCVGILSGNITELRIVLVLLNTAKVNRGSSSAETLPKHMFPAGEVWDATKRFRTSSRRLGGMIKLVVGQSLLSANDLVDPVTIQLRFLQCLQDRFGSFFRICRAAVQRFVDQKEVFLELRSKVFVASPTS